MESIQVLNKKQMTVNAEGKTVMANKTISQQKHIIDHSQLFI